MITFQVPVPLIIMIRNRSLSCLQMSEHPMVQVTNRHTSGYKIIHVFGEVSSAISFNKPSFITMTSQWAWWRLRSPASRLFYLPNRLFERRSEKTSKLRVTGLCAGNSPGTGEFSAQMASNAENVFIWWRHLVSSIRRRSHRWLSARLQWLQCVSNGVTAALH